MNWESPVTDNTANGMTQVGFGAGAGGWQW